MSVPHDRRASSELVPPEFAEALVRLAVHQYPHSASLAGAVKRLMAEDVLPNAARTDVDAFRAGINSHKVLYRRGATVCSGGMHATSRGGTGLAVNATPLTFSFGRTHAHTVPARVSTPPPTPQASVYGVRRRGQITGSICPYRHHEHQRVPAAVEGLS